VVGGGEVEVDAVGNCERKFEENGEIAGVF
jgi:hypothetical protein